MIFAIASGVALSLCGFGSVELEHIRVPLRATGWIVINSQDSPGHGNTIERVPAGESASRWTKLISIQFVEGSKVTPVDFMEALRKKMVDRCPQVDWKIIESDKASVLYEWGIASCAAAEDQHEIARILQGNDGLHRAAYVEKASQMDTSTHDSWLANLRASFVMKDGKPIALKDRK